MNQNQNNFLNVIPTGILLFTVMIFSQSFCAVAAAPKIVGMSVAPSNNQCYVWYDDGMVSVGNTVDLDTHRPLYRYSLPQGKFLNSIVSIGIDANSRVYTWYNNGTMSVGTPDDLDAYRPPYAYSLPSGKWVNSIVSMGISTKNHVYTWYNDGTVSVGTPDDLAAYNTPYSYPLPERKLADNLAGTAIPHNEDYVYAWYIKASSSYFEYTKNNTPSSYVHTSGYTSTNASEDLQFSVSPVSNFNSTSSDFAPSFYKNQLMFSTFRKGNNNNGNSNQIYISMRSGEKLARPRSLGRGHRAILNQSDPSFAENGRRVAYVRNKNFDDGTMPHMNSGAKMDIYLADVASQNDWQNERRFAHNSRKYSNGYPYLTPEGDVLYFASDKSGGYGGFDIYACKKIGKSWSKPMNLGPEINTESDEISPFLIGNTLYFASDTYGGYGGFDVYKSVYVDKEWQQVVNMGGDLNSYHDDYDFIYKPYEKIAYFTSNRVGGVGYDDIYQATVSESMPLPTIPVAPAVKVEQPLPKNTAPDYMAVIVRDKSTQRPLDGVRINLSACNGKIYMTDMNGLAILDQFDGRCAIRISRDGYGETIHHLPMIKQFGVELERLTPVYTTSVADSKPVSQLEQMVLIVRDKTTKLPLDGVQIDLTDCNGKIYMTDANGLAILERFNYDCTARIHKSGYEKSLHRFPSMAQLGIELNQITPSFVSSVTALESTPKPSPVSTNYVKNIYNANPESHRLPSPTPAAYEVSSSVSYTNDIRKTYEVQIGAFYAPRLEELRRFESLGSVYYHMKNDLSVYKVGPFSSYNDAERARAFISNNGYSDAFIRGISGTTTTTHSLPMQYYSSTSSGNNIVYKIQLGAFRNPKNAAFNPQLEYFGNMQQTIRADGITVFLLGDYNNMSDATTAQETAINLGVSKAFIVKYLNGVKIE